MHSGTGARAPTRHSPNATEAVGNYRGFPQSHRMLRPAARDRRGTLKLAMRDEFVIATQGRFFAQDSLDDVIRASNGAFYGLASAF